MVKPTSDYLKPISFLIVDDKSYMRRVIKNVLETLGARLLEEGMVIAMEPHLGHWHIQDMWVVRASGPDLISAKFPTDRIFDCG